MTTTVTAGGLQQQQLPGAGAAKTAGGARGGKGKGSIDEKKDAPGSSFKPAPKKGHQVGWCRLDPIEPTLKAPVTLRFKAVQVDPMKPTLNAPVPKRSKALQVDPSKLTLKVPGSKRLSLKYDELLSSFAFSFKWRQYNQVTLTVIGEGNMFGEMEILLGVPRFCTVVAVGPGR